MGAFIGLMLAMQIEDIRAKVRKHEKFERFSMFFWSFFIGTFVLVLPLGEAVLGFLYERDAPFPRYLLFGSIDLVFCFVTFILFAPLMRQIHDEPLKIRISRR